MVKEHGHLDILVNNAGITRDNLLMKMSEEDFDAVIQTNLKGRIQLYPPHCKTDVKTEERTYHQYLLCIRCFRKCRTGKLLCSKAGVIGLTKSAAKELASRGITVNAVAPGFIKTEMTEVLKDEIKIPF